MVPSDFSELMLNFWMVDENLTEEEARGFYWTKEFDEFSSRISSKTLLFKPDLGYSNKDVDGTLCFETEDNNFVIPVNILQTI